MLDAGRRIELVVGIAKAELRQEPPRRIVLRMMPREERARVEDAEGMIDHRPRGLSGISVSPAAWPEMKTQRVDGCVQVVGPEPATADVPPGRPQKDGPVLDAVRLLRCDLPFEPLADLALGEGPTDPAGDLGIAPERPRRGEVIRAPEAEPEPLGVQEIRRDHFNPSTR